MQQLHAQQRMVVRRFERELKDAKSEVARYRSQLDDMMFAFARGGAAASMTSGAGGGAGAGAGAGAAGGASGGSSRAVDKKFLRRGSRSRVYKPIRGRGRARSTTDQPSGMALPLPAPREGGTESPAPSASAMLRQGSTPTIRDAQGFLPPGDGGSSVAGEAPATPPRAMTRAEAVKRRTEAALGVMSVSPAYSPTTPAGTTPPFPHGYSTPSSRPASDRPPVPTSSGSSDKVSTTASPAKRRTRQPRRSLWEGGINKLKALLPGRGGKGSPAKSSEPQTVRGDGVCALLDACIGTAHANANPSVCPCAHASLSDECRRCRFGQAWRHNPGCSQGWGPCCQRRHCNTRASCWAVIVGTVWSVGHSTARPTTQRAIG